MCPSARMVTHTLEADLLANDVQQLLQRAERAGPAAEKTSAKDDHGDDDEDPEQEDERVAEEQRPFPLEQDRMEPGQHLRDRGLGQQPEAHPADADHPEAVLEAVDRPLVLVGGAARQWLAQRIDGADGHQHQRKQADRQPACLPDLQPGRVRTPDLGPAALQVIARQPVFAVEGQKAFLAVGIDLVGQKAELPGIGRRKGRRAQDEDARFGEAWCSACGDAVEVAGIGVTEAEGVAVLVDQDAVVDAAAHEARALEGFLPVAADDEQRVLAFLQLTHQVLPAALAEDRRSDDGGVERAEPEFDGGGGTAGLADLLGLHHQLADGTLSHQRFPVGQGLAGGRLHVLHRLAHHWLDDADLPGHGRPGGHDDLVLGDDGDGGARNRVDADHAVLGARLADLDAVTDRFAKVLIVEGQQGRLGNAQQQDRFGMLEYLDADKLSGRVHADQRDDRLAGIGGRVGDVGGEHHVAQHLLAIGTAQGLDIRRLSLAGGKACGARKHVLAGNQCAQVGGTRQFGG